MGDDLNWCESLRCKGGRMLSCKEHNGGWSYKSVECVSPPQSVENSNIVVILYASNLVT